MDLKASIIIPSLNRPKSLKRVLSSLESQKVTPLETLVLSEEGELARIRNDGAKKAKGDILIFIDDDVWCPPEWLGGILEGFKKDSVAGVSGPTVISWQFMAKRDLFRFPTFKKIYDKAFLNGMERLPGRITPAGAWTTGACFKGCNYEGLVQFLEACNMAYRREVFRSVGGFDERFKGIGDWSEPDLSFRIRRLGRQLWFTQKARLYHEPSRSGAFKKRSLDSRNRLQNYELFASRWVRPYWRHTLYKQFLRTYYWIKSNGWLD